MWELTNKTTINYCTLNLNLYDINFKLNMN